jgi:DNA-directed RNA polymerase III subunit RPC6
MASSNEVDIVALKTKLYDRLLEEQDDNPGAVWHQHEIMELGIVKDLTILLGVAQLLINEKLFKAVHEQGELGWVLRTPLEARQYVLIYLFYP